MAGSTFGKIWQFTSFGESHGAGIGVVIEGCPAGLEIDKAFIESELARRRPGQSAIVTQRKEPDTCEILSGTMEGISTGTPIAIWIANQNQKSKDYSHIADKYRPSHADFTYTAKYGIRDYRGGGTPAGLGEPVYDRLHADLGKAMLSINAVKGFDYGSGFDTVSMKGSDHNDEYFTDDSGKVQTKTNFSGGIQGGISNGMDIYFRVAFKPVATIMQDQSSVDEKGEKVIVSGKGRHDPCVVPRAVPIVEAMAANVLADHFLRSRTNKMENLID